MKEVFTVEQIGKAIHYMLSGFKVAVGQRPYKHWEDLDPDTKRLFTDAIEFVTSGERTPEDIHNYWAEYAKKVNPTHESLIPFDELSEIEKLKDEFVITIINHMVKYNGRESEKVVDN